MKQLIVIMFAFLPILSMAQKAVRQNVRSGNKQYLKERYSEADVAYRKALEINPNSPEANYNLANTMYKQKKYKEANQQYEVALPSITKPEHAFATYHNMGDCQMQLKDYSKSVENYKKALRLNPTDNETRYNLALAQALLKNQQKQNKDDKKNKDKKNKDKKNQDKKDQNKQDQDKKQDQKDKKDQQKQPQDPNQMSKENAQQMLDAFMQDEKGTQDKMKQQQMKQRQKRVSSKDW